MQQREKILLACVLALLGLMGLRYGYGMVTAAFDARENQITALRRDISKKELEVLAGRRASKRLAAYEARSLPADAERAQSLYQDWLIDLLDESGLAGGVISQAPQSKRNSFHRLNFTLSGEGSLSEVVRLLHGFYAANHLHQVRSLMLKPAKEGREFELLLTVEALALPGALHTTALPAAPSARLDPADLAAYQQPITERNLFAPYEPPREEEPPPEFDVARYTTVSAIVHSNGRRQVWLNNRVSGDVLKLHEGGQFEVGSLRGQVDRIGRRAVEIRLDDQRWLLELGETLRDGAPLPEGEL